MKNILFYYILFIFNIYIVYSNNITINYTLCNNTITIPCIFNKNVNIPVNWTYNNIKIINKDVLKLNFLYNLSEHVLTCSYKIKNNYIKNDIYLKFTNKLFSDSEVDFIICTVYIIMLTIWIDIFIVTFRINNTKHIINYYVSIILTTITTISGQYIILNEYFESYGISLIQLSIFIFVIIQIKLYTYLNQSYFFLLLANIQMIFFITSTIIIIISKSECYKYIYSCIYSYSIVFILIFSHFYMIILLIAPITYKVKYSNFDIILY
ncbi:CD47-like protein [Cotia virus SPAn232]|uniref:CD47-like protein n=2 Tax=Cotia virus TaxID=39444 RepID=H6TAB4_9POXV|nr:CD47-like protein [Cotia virus SPAn232]AFB76948.1 CD47-like protein [Cotia virus SPAn232]AIT70761.1 CD47-like protein [Cotia virus]